MTAGAPAAPAAEAVAAPPRRRRRWPGALVLVVLVALVAMVLVPRLGGPALQPSALVGRVAPPLQGETLDGGRLDLAQLRGHVVLVNVWASWCAPCRREYPLLTSAQAQLSPLGLRIVGINVRERPEQARAFVDEYAGQAAWPSVMDPDGTRAVDWGTLALPETYLVDRDGTVVAKVIGELDAEWLTDIVVPLLDGGEP